MASFYDYEKATPYRFDRGMVPQTGDLVIVKTTMLGGIYLDKLPMFVVGYIMEAPDNCRDNDVVILINGQTRKMHYSWLRRMEVA